MIRLIAWVVCIVTVILSMFAVANNMVILNSHITSIHNLVRKNTDASKEKFSPQFTKEKQGLKDVAFITMVKDEDDIIYQNLVWHFAVGFRKFVIFDNNSTDNTLLMIEKFIGETRDLATVFVINDPIEVHNQNKIITSGYRMAHEIWPEVKWFFPVDADEFWVFSQEPEMALAGIPDNVDVLSAIKLRYRPTDGYDYASDSNNFWHKLRYRDAGWSSFDEDSNKYNITPKVFLKYSKNFSLAMGNHYVVYNGPLSRKADENEGVEYHNDLYDVVYGSSDLYGIHLREYHMRSIEQTHKKFNNGLKAATMLGSPKKDSLRAGKHWIDYQNYLSSAGDPKAAAEMKFKKYGRPLNEGDVIDDPLAIDEAIKVYHKLLR